MNTRKAKTRLCRLCIRSIECLQNRRNEVAGRIPITWELRKSFSSVVDSAQDEMRCHRDRNRQQQTQGNVGTSEIVVGEKKDVLPRNTAKPDSWSSAFVHASKVSPVCHTSRPDSWDCQSSITTSSLGNPTDMTCFVQHLSHLDTSRTSAGMCLLIRSPRQQRLK